MVQCTSQLRQMGQALVMYDIDHNRQLENYPDRLTHLHALGYAPDARIFVCPMDSTKAQDVVLKPGKPKDDKSDWRERVGFAANGIPEQNSSYLYEFSTRSCQSYKKNASNQFEWIGSGFGTDALIGWYTWEQVAGDEQPALDEYYYYDFELGYWGDESRFYLITPNPQQVDRDTNFQITWQEAKFWQLEYGDVYTTGVAWPGDMYVPYIWSDEPAWTIGTDAEAQHGYARTWMPIVRCFWHCTPALIDMADEFNYGPEEVLNLAVDGNIFYSVPGWEQTAWKYGRFSNPEY